MKDGRNGTATEGKRNAAKIIESKSTVLLRSRALLDKLKVTQVVKKFPL
jgi:hypothetical protein